MDRSIVSRMPELISIAIILIATLLVVFGWLSRRKRIRRPRLVHSSGGHIEEQAEGTEEDLRRAEEEVRKLAFNPREELLQSHTLFAKFRTTQGYSETYMTDLVRAMEKEGLLCTYLFQETLPYGSISHRHGVFELYVPRDQVEEAERFLARWKP
jgi:hypothetical protein